MDWKVSVVFPNLSPFLLSSHLFHQFVFSPLAVSPERKCERVFAIVRFSPARNQLKQPWPWAWEPGFGSASLEVGVCECVCSLCTTFSSLSPQHKNNSCERNNTWRKWEGKIANHTRTHTHLVMMLIQILPHSCQRLVHSLFRWVSCAHTRTPQCH